MSKITDNLVLVQQRISKALTDAGRAENDTQLLAVSKTKPAEFFKSEAPCLALYARSSVISIQQPYASAV
ncbi:MAG: hypothetical protein AAFN68_02780, partial [Pseudomonadota bacterium]